METENGEFLDFISHTNKYHAMGISSGLECKIKPK